MRTLILTTGPYLWLGLFYLGAALGLAALWRSIDAIERRAQPKPRRRRA